MVGENNKAVILIPVAAGLAVVLQFEIAFLKPYFFRHEQAVVVGHVRHGENDAALPDKMTLAGEFLPAEAHPKDNGWRCMIMRHRKRASLRWRTLQDSEWRPRRPPLTWLTRPAPCTPRQS